MHRHRVAPARAGHGSGPLPPEGAHGVCLVVRQRVPELLAGPVRQALVLRLLGLGGVTEDGDVPLPRGLHLVAGDGAAACGDPVHGQAAEGVHLEEDPGGARQPLVLQEAAPCHGGEGASLRGNAGRVVVVLRGVVVHSVDVRPNAAQPLLHDVGLDGDEVHLVPLSQRIHEHGDIGLVQLQRVTTVASRPLALAVHSVQALLALEQLFAKRIDNLLGVFELLSAAEPAEVYQGLVASEVVQEVVLRSEE
mmetsp:Transcript_6080/g.16669  ORF Transcript_6080/g.16669 Transcript_6080/m.16669 type:complete len:250 (+) Transcript_6080:217-966(+)